MLLMQFLWKYIDDLVGKGLEWSVISELLFYASSTFVPMALPLAILISSIMTFGNLGEHYELVALKSSGISLQRIMKPLIILSIVISGLAFVFSNYVMPVANLKMRSLLYDVRHLRPEINIKEGIFFNGIEGFSIKISKKNKKTKMLYKLMLYDHSKRDGNISVTLADSGYMNLTKDGRFLIMKLYNGIRYEEMPEDGIPREDRKYPHRRDSFTEQKIIFELEGFGLERTDEELFKDHYEMLNITQLNKTIDSLEVSFIDRKKTFGENLYRANYFKRLDRKLANDTINYFDTISMNSDSLFNSLNLTDKNKSIKLAGEFARTTKTYINTMKEDFTARQEWIRRHEIEWHRKFTLSIACLILFFIGAPLGAIIRRGGLGMPVVVSIVFFIMYYLISIMGEKFSREAVIPVYQGMWLSSAILFPLGVFLTYKATTDSTIMNTDTYTILYQKIIKFFRRKQ